MIGVTAKNMTRQTKNTMKSHTQNRSTVPSSCTRCGTCCKKGGPSLHVEDREQIEKGNIPLKYLFTIRKYEPSFDNIKNVIKPATTDIIKIKSKTNSHECVFFDPAHSGCQIYHDRPIECRTLKCWDTRDIISLYDKDRISRKELLSGIDELWDLVQDHQERCSYEKITILAVQVKEIEKNHEALQKINAMIQYDDSLRQLLIEKMAMAPEMLEFLLGRPLSKTITLFGLTPKIHSPSTEPPV